MFVRFFSRQPVLLGVKLGVAGAFPRGYSCFHAAGPIYCDLGMVLERLVSPDSLERLVSGQRAARSCGWKGAPFPLPQASLLPHIHACPPLPDRHKDRLTPTHLHPRPHTGWQTHPVTPASRLSHTCTHMHVCRHAQSPRVPLVEGRLRGAVG